jgi:hypothetical protein
MRRFLQDTGFGVDQEEKWAVLSHQVALIIWTIEDAKINKEQFIEFIDRLLKYVVVESQRGDKS